MKKEQFKRKLVLNKETITNLSKPQLKGIRGGTRDECNQGTFTVEFDLYPECVQSFPLVCTI